MGQPTLIEMLWEIALRNGIHCCYCCSVPKSCQTLRPHRLQQATLSCPSLSPSLLKLMSIELVMPSNHPILCRPLLPPSIFPSIRVFSNESVLHIRWPKYWSFSFCVSLSYEYSGWFPLGLTGLISLLSKGVSRVFSSTTIQKHLFFSTHPSLQSFWFLYGIHYDFANVKPGFPCLVGIIEIITAEMGESGWNRFHSCNFFKYFIQRNKLRYK